MKSPKPWLAVLLALALLLFLPPLLAPHGDDALAGPVKGLRVMVPNSPGGGYDITARTAVKAMEDDGLADGVEVFNLPGAGGTVGLGRLVNERGNGSMIMSMGLGVVGSVYSNKSPATLADTTPIAKLVEEPNLIVVGKDSKYHTIDQLIADWRKNPQQLAVGGGSSPGGPDHLAPMLMAKAAGVEPKRVNFVSYDGGGELMAAVLGGKLAFASSGIGEFLDQIEAGQLRVLAVTSAERVPALDAPTLKESGLDATFTNWRGVVAPPGISADEQKRLIRLFTDLRTTPQWKQALTRNNWTDAFSTGDSFGEFLASEDRRVAGILTELGLR